MFKELWKRITDYVSPPPVLYKENLVSEYKLVVKNLQIASSLAELLEVRKQIREFQQLLIQNKSELWGRSYMMDLTKLWNAKYKYWKRKARGG